MKPGYYWAKHRVRGWIIVKVTPRLHGAVLEDGCAVKLEWFDEIDDAPIVRDGPPEVKRETITIPQP